MAALEIRSLAKHFGRTKAVRDVSLSVDRGQVYGLLGPNGSGKTTTLSCALGLLRPTGGDIRVLGFPAHKIHRTRGRVGAAFDVDCLLTGLRVRENLEYAQRLLGHNGGRAPTEALRLVGIERLSERRAGRLSLGERKRVSIARALLGDPELLVLDEPLSALDTIGARAMLRLVQRLAEDGHTLVLSSHRLHEMETVITHAGVVVGGRLVREGPIDELLGAGRGRYRLRLAPPERAERVCEELAGVERLERRVVDGELELVLRLDGRPQELNRALVEAGCDVIALIPERSDLQSLFESLVDEVTRAEAAS